MRLWRVSPLAFKRALGTARARSERVRQATTPTHEWDWDAPTDFYLSDDLESGFAVKSTGELVGVFSVVKGRGDWLVGQALDNGATHLDCFDGYLPEFYGRHGFRVVKREANWTPGEPDVVYMRRAV